MYSFEQIADILDNIVDSLPQEILTGLSGIYLDHQIKHNDKIPSDNYYVMGEYIVSPPLDPRVELHYGSIVAVHDRLCLSDMQRKLHHIVLHELRHHLETRAGCDDLVKIDNEYVKNALAKISEKEEQNAQSQ